MTKFETSQETLQDCSIQIQVSSATAQKLRSTNACRRKSYSGTTPMRRQPETVIFPNYLLPRKLWTRTKPNITSIHLWPSKEPQETEDFQTPIPNSEKKYPGSSQQRRSDRLHVVLILRVAFSTKRKRFLCQTKTVPPRNDWKKWRPHKTKSESKNAKRSLPRTAIKHKSSSISNPRTSISKLYNDQPDFQKKANSRHAQPTTRVLHFLKKRKSKGGVQNDWLETRVRVVLNWGACNHNERVNFLREKKREDQIIKKWWRK